jgi:WD40 repeat protein
LEPLSLNPILTHPERVTSAAFDPIGHKIVTASADGTVRIWDIAGAVNAPFPLTRAYNRRASRFLTVSNNTVQLFDALTELPAGGAIRLQSDVEYTMQSRDGQFVAIVSKAPTNEPPGERIAQVFAVSTGERVGPVITISGPLKIGALSDDGMRLALHDDASLEIRDIRSGRTVFPPLKPASSVERIQFSPDRKRIATWGGNTVQLWDAEAGKPSFDQFEMEAPVKSVEFSSDGSYLAAACADRGLNKRFARVWKTATGKPGPPLRHGDGVLCASFSPDNKYLVTGGEDYAAMVWEFATGRLMFPAIRHPNQVGAAAFSPNSKWIVTICADNAARVFNAATGEPVTPPLRHLGSPRTVMFLPDSSKIVTADLHGRTWVWDLSAIHSSVEDLSLLSRLLSGDSLRAAGDTSPQEPAAVKAICERLRVSCPSAFTVSSNQVTAWHEFQALELEDEGHKQWPAAAFHWKELLKLRPGDPDITEHLKRAEQKMAEPKPTDE